MNGKCLILVAIAAAMLLHDPAPGLATSVPVSAMTPGTVAASDVAMIGNPFADADPNGTDFTDNSDGMLGTAADVLWTDGARTDWTPIYPTDAFFVISSYAPAKFNDGFDLAYPPQGSMGPAASMGGPAIAVPGGPGGAAVVPEPLTLLGVLLGVGYAGQYLRRRNGRTKMSPTDQEQPDA